MSTRSKTLQQLKAVLGQLQDGPELYEFVSGIPGREFGWVPGRQYSLGVTDDDGSYRSVLSYRVRDDGSVDLVRTGKPSSP